TISKLIDEAETLARSGDFDRALERIEAGSRQFPGNSRLARYREAIGAQKLHYERELLRKEALERVNQLLTQHKLEEAAGALEEVVKSYGEDQDTAALARSIA